MKKLYIILIAALLLTLAACLTACSAKPVSLRGTEAPNLPGPANDALKVTDEGQDWNITLEQVDKENFAEDDRLLAKIKDGLVQRAARLPVLFVGAVKHGGLLMLPSS